MSSKLNIIFIFVAIAMVAIVFNFDSVKELGVGPAVESKAEKFEDKKSEIQKFFSEQKWYNYDSAATRIDLGKMGSTKIIYLHF